MCPVIEYVSISRLYLVLVALCAVCVLIARLYLPHL